MRRRAVGIIMALGAVLSPMAAGLPAQAAGGVEVTANVIYTANSFTEVLNTQLTLDLRNVKSPTQSGNTTTNYYYDGYSFGIHPSALNIEVHEAGESVGFEVEVNEDGFVFIVVDFNSRLNYLQTTTLDVDYDIPGPPRTDNLIRVNGALVSAYLYAWGDPGLGSVSLVLPDGQVPDFVGDQQLQPSTEKSRTWVDTDIDDPDAWWAIVDARNNDLLTIVPLTITAHNIVLRAWPTDGEWLETASSVITAGQPEMVKLLGLDWPIDETLIVQESIDPTLSGYGGWFFTDDALIEIGEHLDANLILHEVSHAWFNDDMFHARWIGEGFAEFYGRKTAELIGDGGGVAAEPLSFHPDRFDLNTWPNPSSEADRGQELWGYDTSFYIIQTIVEEVGDDAMREVLQVAYDHSNAYSSDLDEPTGVAEWRRFLDMLEEVGGSTVARELFSEWVLPESRDVILDERDAARTAYHAVLDHGGNWELPLNVAENMSHWNFEIATALISEAEEVLDLRDQAAARATDLNLTLPDVAEVAYETSNESFSATTNILHSEIASLDKMSAALDASRMELNWLHELGLYKEDVPKELAEARDALEAGEFHQADTEAQELIDLMAGAEAEGELRARKIAAAAGGVILGLVLVIWALRRRRKPGSGQLPIETTEAQADAPE
jgi:hypothetical protein